MTNQTGTLETAPLHAGQVAARFRRSAEALRALQAAERLGYTRSDIHVVTRRSNINAADLVPADPVRGDKPMEGPWFGALIGALLGAASGFMAGLWIPPAVGLAVPPLWAALLLGGLLGLVGFYLGSLVGVGLPEGREREFQEAVDEGEVLLSVNPRTEADAANIRNAWARLGAQDVAG